MEEVGLNMEPGYHLSMMKRRPSGFSGLAFAAILYQMLVYLIFYQNITSRSFIFFVSQQSKYIYFYNWHRNSPYDSLI